MKFRYSSRWGRFEISSDFIFHTMSKHVAGNEDKTPTEYFKAVVELMSQVLIFRASENPATGSIEYWGISPLFNELEEGDAIPMYELKEQYVTDKDNNKYLEYVLSSGFVIPNIVAIEVIFCKLIISRLYTIMLFSLSLLDFEKQL